MQLACCVDGASNYRGPSARKERGLQDDMWREVPSSEPTILKPHT